MPRPMSILLAVLPALVVALFAFALGGFASATGFPQAPMGEAILLALSLGGATRLADPLGLGRRGRWLVGGLLALALASWAVSPVPRAGRVAVVLLPAFVLLPGAFARVMEGERARRWALSSWAVAVVVVSGWALAVAAREGWARASAPLGHHNLLAAWLAITLPVAAAGLAERGWPRALAALALGFGGGALFATRSLVGMSAAGLAVWLGARRLRRGRHLLIGVALLAVAALVPRADSILLRRDASARARETYAAAALAGARERDLLGWGPGALPWTLPRFLHPVPGVNPAGELVGEPHTTPLRIAYEMGFPALLLVFVIGGWFAWRRTRDTGHDFPLAQGGRLGLLAGVVTALGGSWLAVPALPVALAAAAGAALTGVPPPVRRARRRMYRVVVWLYVVVAAASLLRPAMARQAYLVAARAGASPRARTQALERAVRLDPDFPLYRARSAWDGEDPLHRRALEAHRAATEARGVAPLWLHAGTLALEAGDKGPAYIAFERAMALDPLAGEAPFLMYVASGGRDLDCAARAFVADPRLAAATYWRRRLADRAAAIQRVEQWPGVDAGWRRDFVRWATAAPPSGGKEVDLVFRIDSTPVLSASLHLFRRPPWPEELARIRLDLQASAALRIPSAASLPSTSGARVSKPQVSPRGGRAPGPTLVSRRDRHRSGDSAAGAHAMS